jgi:16S rRNA (uracil1498-N3)-methyltransferase
MSVRRLFCSRRKLEDGLFTITGDEAYHGATVLRLRPGDDVRVFTEQGSEFNCRVVDTGKGRLRAEILEKMTDVVESDVHIVLIQALPKAAKLEQIIVHGTELGMTRLVPVVTERSVARGERRERWRRMALEATKQSGRRRIPFIEPLMPLDSLDLDQFGDALRLVAAEPPHTGSLQELLRAHAEIDLESVVVAVGPEGGFEQRELDWLIRGGFSPFTMGPRILRTETASLAAMAAIQYELGDWYRES